jgi:ZIP family zinc transporter
MDAMLGFAAGVMIAASFWSLLAPSIEMSVAQGITAWLPAVIGFLAGGIFLRLCDAYMPHLHLGFPMEEAEGIPTSWRRATLLVLAITIHNIPEGVAISIPLRDLGLSEWKMVGAAIFSSVPQPIGAIIAYYFVTLAREFLPYGFGFAAGAMTLLVVHELIPEALERGQNLPGNGKKELSIGLVLGILFMVPLMLF